MGRVTGLLSSKAVRQKQKKLNPRETMKTTNQPLQTMKRTAEKLAFSLAICALLAPTVASALMPFFPFTDDFQDGSASDDAPVSFISGGYPVTITVDNGDLVLTNPLQLQGFSVGAADLKKSGQ